MKSSTGTALLLLLVLLSFMGCSGPALVVLDSAGAPIEGAKIVGISLSITGQTSYSNKKGYAPIPSAVQKTKWISVYKEGYSPVEYIDASQKKPIIVKMTKEKK